MDLVTGSIYIGGLFLVSQFIKNGLGFNSSKNFEKLFYELKLFNTSEEYPSIINKNKEKYYMRYTIELPIGLSIDDIKKYEENISAFLECENVLIEKQSNSKMIDILHMHTKPNVEYDYRNQKRSDFNIPIGVNLRTGENFLLDLFSDSNANLYIAGSPGQGKTNILNVILGHLANSKNENEVQFAIHDTKLVDLPLFEKCKNTVSYYSGAEKVNEFLDNEIKEMNARFELLRKYGFRNIRDFINNGYEVPYRVVVIEEISLFSNNEEFHKKLSDLTSKGRSAGITVIMVTQIPTYDVLPTRIKNNVNTSIGLKVRNSVCSEIVMNDADLHKLSGCGHFKITDSSNYNIEVQSYYITDETLKKILN